MPTPTPKATPAAAPTAPDLKALAEGLARHEDALQQILQLLKGTQHDDTRKILNTVLDSVRSMAKLLHTYAAQPAGSMVMIALNQGQAHLQQVVLVLMDVDLSAHPEAA